jgi:hypothetical protein
MKVMVSARAIHQKAARPDPGDARPEGPPARAVAVSRLRGDPEPEGGGVTVPVPLEADATGELELRGVRWVLRVMVLLSRP